MMAERMMAEKEQAYGRSVAFNKKLESFFKVEKNNQRP